MDLVINDIVKMEWEKSHWVQTKGTKGKEGIFIFACKEYENNEGDVIPVFFRSTLAWVLKDEDGDFISYDDLRNYVKSNFDSSFPEYLDGYVNLYELGDESCNTDVLECYGLMEYEEDIKKRVLDLAPYGESPEED